MENAAGDYVAEQIGDPSPPGYPPTAHYQYTVTVPGCECDRDTGACACILLIDVTITCQAAWPEMDDAWRIDLTIDIGGGSDISCKSVWHTECSWEGHGALPDMRTCDDVGTLYDGTGVGTGEIEL
jgi:hypothetical protein